MRGFTDPVARPAMDFVIAAVRRAELQPGAPRLAAGLALAAEPDVTGPDWEWAVLCLHTRRGLEVAQHLAQFGHKSHAEAFLADLLACSPALIPAGFR